MSPPVTLSLKIPWPRKWVSEENSLTPHLTQYRSFRRRSLKLSKQSEQRNETETETVSKLFRFSFILMCGQSKQPRPIEWKLFRSSDTSVETLGVSCRFSRWNTVFIESASAKRSPPTDSARSKCRRSWVYAAVPIPNIALLSCTRLQACPLEEAYGSLTKRMKTQQFF